MDNFESKKFIESARTIVGKDVTEMFSPKDIDPIAHELG